MIKEQHFLHRSRFDLAIFRQAHRHFGEAVRLSRAGETEAVGLAFVDPDQTVDRWRRGEEIGRQDQAEQRNSRRIGYAPDPPSRTMAFDQPRRQARDDEQSDRHDQRQYQYRPPCMAQDVMAQFMAHDRRDFVRTGSLQEIVIERDPDRRADARDIGRNALVLPRLVEHVDMIRRNIIFRSHRDDPVAHRPLRHLAIVVEQRRNEHRSEQQPDEQEGRDHSGSPDPPCLGRAPDHRKNRHDQQRKDDQGDDQPDHLLTEPAGKILTHQSILLLPEEVAVDRPRQSEQESGENIGKRIKPGLQPCSAGHPFRPVPEPGGEARLENQQIDEHPDQRPPEDQPVSALEIGIGFLQLGTLQAVDIGAAGLLDIEGRRGVLGKGRFRRQAGKQHGGKDKKQ